MLAETKPSLEQIRTWLSGRHNTLWLGALSFENRCYGSLLELQQNGLRITSGIALNYPTTVHPSMEDKERRRDNWQIISNLKNDVCIEGMELYDVQPYSLYELQSKLDEIINSEVELVILDITCMTKVHTMALAAAIARSTQKQKWVVAYTSPENYGNLADSQKTFGWQDIIIAPLTEKGLLNNEAESRGIIITGHEADRLVVAFAELEPSGGLIIIAETQKRPDLRRLNEHLNRKMLGQLSRMKSKLWNKTVVGIFDLPRLSMLVANEISLAKRNEAPIIFLPYGPKSLIFFTAFQLAADYPDGSWFIYPIPTSYDVNYSEGIEGTLWLQLD